VSTRVDYLRRDKLAWLLATQALIILPLLFYLPVWLWLVWSLTALWRIQMFRGHWGAPGPLVKGLMVGGCALGIMISFRGSLTTETMVSLLLCAFVLKLLEVKSRRDAQLLIFIGFITCATQLLFNQSPLAAFYSLLCCWLLLGSWRAIYLLHSQPLRRGLKRSGLLVLQALPIMALMFVVLPRLGPLWAIPNQNKATSGFSDTMSPGDIGELVLSKAPAFRVAFEGAPPAANQLYWRGLIMNNYDGRSWHLREQWNPQIGAMPGQPSAKSLINYTIILEPHGRRWLFGLTTPIALDAGKTRALIGADQLLLTRQAVTQRLRYKVISARAFNYPQAPQLSPTERLENTRLPPQGNPRARALAESWRAQGLNDEAIIAKALALYGQDFVYTLKPPTLGANAVDEFLFATKRGFCEHFASSLAFLLRAAAIPARLVVGYQGGRWNELENYLLVSQSDAHAWVEVWTPSQGWRTLDPTAEVAPERIETGLDNALSAEDLNLVQSPWDRSALLLALQKRWDAAAYNWQRWVLNYDSEAQEGLFKRWLGGSEPWRLALWLLGLGLAAAGVFAWFIRQRDNTRAQTPETRLVRRLERKLAARGLLRPPGTSLRDFCRQVQDAQLNPKLMAICDSYEAIAYGLQQPQQRQQQLTSLRQLIRAL